MYFTFSNYRALILVSTITFKEYLSNLEVLDTTLNNQAVSPDPTGFS